MELIKIYNEKGDVETSVLINEICDFLSDEFQEDEVQINKQEVSKQGTKGLITIASVVTILKSIGINILAAIIYDVAKESIKRAYSKDKQNSISCVKGERCIVILDNDTRIITIKWK